MAESEMVEDGRIRQLDERTIGFIAAGEVVERPAQVVKELLENSIDAGAEWITVEIQRGGFDLIKVSDDGGGIHRQDLALALDRHATSKLRDEHDLSSINTLGFRGEALASIGMVSNLMVSSRASADDSDSGWCI
nr:DNA mismatch repair endonuclease MutL [Candidatus Poseidoniaceae archaeon]